MKILVTGGAGFIGSHLVDRLIDEGHQVVVIDNLSTGSRKNLNSKAKLWKMDIQSSKVKEVFEKEKPNAVFHLAAQIDLRKSVEDPIKDAKINILGSLNILQSFYNSCHSHCKFIFTSTGGAIYGDADIIPTPESYPEKPLSPYGAEKLVFDKYLNYYNQVFNLPYVSLRLANVYGPRQNSKGEAGVVAIFSDAMLSGNQPIIFGSGKQTRDFVYVKDVVEAAVSALKKNKIGIHNIGTAKQTDINTVFSKIKKITGSECREIHQPAKPGEQKTSCLNIEKAKKELGWQPKYDLDKGLEETVKWFAS